MAHVQSAAIVAIEAGEFLNPPVMLGSTQKMIVILAAAAMAANDTHGIIRLPSSARIVSIKIATDDLGTTLTADIGVGTPNVGAAPTAVDADCLVDGFDLATAIAIWTEALGNAGNGPPPEEMGTMLWEMAGESVDPDEIYEIYLTAATSGTPALGDVALLIEWASGMGAS